ncbi:WD40 repeat domain-containing protein [Pedobacter nyackensis]|uniref:WD40 repeat domain-containing protein n=1 Tax=Pedobacter nyackensis TaxID=475255 RepID=UPI00292D8241|nr:WD40 repeat domain-containing protein [Pedobacter nyackensis]
MITHLHTLSGHQNPIYALANSNKMGAFFSAGNDKGVVEWSLETMSFAKIILPVQSSVYALHIYKDLLFIAQRSGLIQVFDLLEQKVKATLSHHQKGVFDVKTIAYKNEIISTGEDGTVAVWSLNDFSLLYNFPVIQNTVRTIALNKNEKEVALGCKDGIIRIYNSEDYALIKELAGHQFAVTALQYSPDDTYLISGSRDAQLKIWNLPDYNLLETVPAHMFSVYAIVFHPTLPYFATCSQDKSIKLWDSRNFKLYKILSLEKNTPGHSHSINKLIWSYDGKYLISTGDDRQVMVWELIP